MSMDRMCQELKLMNRLLIQEVFRLETIRDIEAAQKELNAVVKSMKKSPVADLMGVSHEEYSGVDANGSPIREAVQ